MIILTPQEKAFIRWALQYLVSPNSVNINPEGRFFFRKKFFEEMATQEDQLNDLGRMHWLSIQEKIYAPHHHIHDPQKPHLNFVSLLKPKANEKQEKTHYLSPRLEQF